MFSLFKNKQQKKHKPNEYDETFKRFLEYIKNNTSDFIDEIRITENTIAINLKNKNSILINRYSPISFGDEPYLEFEFITLYLDIDKYIVYGQDIVSLYGSVVKHLQSKLTNNGISNQALDTLADIQSDKTTRMIYYVLKYVDEHPNEFEVEDGLSKKIASIDSKNRISILMEDTSEFRNFTIVKLIINDWECSVFRDSRVNELFYKVFEKLQLNEHIPDDVIEVLGRLGIKIAKGDE